MRPRSSFAVALTLLGALALCGASRSAAADPQTYRVRYRSASSAYLDSGRDSGLAVGDRLQVREGAQVWVELEVAYLAERSASCRILKEDRPLKVGDQVTLVVRPSTTPTPATGAATLPTQVPEPTPALGGAPAPPPVPQPQPSPSPRGPWSRARGGVSFGYYDVKDESPAALDFRQTTLRADLSVQDLGGRPVQLVAHLTSRRDERAHTLSSRTPETQRNDRLYELSLRYVPSGGRFAVEAGRLAATPVPSVGYLDGVLVRGRPASVLEVGGFFGRRADVYGLGFEGGGNKYGAFLRLSPGSGWGPNRYDVTTSVVRELAEGAISREYLSLESRFAPSRKLTLFQRAELDLNRDWREALTGRSSQLSNLSVSANLRFDSSSSATLSYDGRRNYRDYRNRSVPEDVFDDLLRQGLRGSLYYSAKSGFGVSAGGGLLFEEGATDQAISFFGGIRHTGLFGRRLWISLDGAGFTNAWTDGFQVTGSLGRWFKNHRLDLTAGYSRYNVKSTSESRQTQFVRARGRLALPRKLFALADFEYDRGDDLKGPRVLLEGGWQF